jgi:hypothetical protein
MSRGKNAKGRGEREKIFRALETTSIYAWLAWKGQAEGERKRERERERERERDVCVYVYMCGWVCANMGGCGPGCEK